MATTITMTTEAGDAPVTVLPMTAAAKRATSPVKVTRSTKRLAAAMTKDAPKEAPRKGRKEQAPAKVEAKAPKAKAGATFTTVDLATEQGINPKSLRARIRRNIEKWEPLFAGERHTFADNATTRKAIAALLAAAN